MPFDSLVSTERQPCYGEDGLLLRGLVLVFNLGLGSREQGLHIRSVLPRRSQFEVLVVGFSAAWRNNICACLRIDRNLARKRLSLEVIRQRTLRIGGDCLVCGSSLGVSVPSVEVNNGFVGVVK